MDLNIDEYESGIKVNFKNKTFKLEFPREVWRSYPKEIKNVLIDNLVYLCTINSPLVADIQEVNYNTSLPLFKTFFDNMILKSIPHSVEEYKDSTVDKIKKFMNTKYNFKDSNIKIPNYKINTNEKAVLALSCGKDSLLSLALANEIGLDPVAIYINDTVSPSENKIKLNFVNKISKEFKIKSHIVTNEIEKLNDFEFWKKPETCLGYNHLMTSFIFISLPFSNFYKARYILVGNEQDNNFLFKNKNGFLTSPSYDQTTEWKNQQNLMINMMSSNVNVISLIEPLSEIGIAKILYSRYKEFAKYQVSCASLDESKEPRWCHKCEFCAHLSLAMLANNYDPKKVGLKFNLLDKKHKKFYILFDTKEKKSHHLYKNKYFRDMILFGFYLAYKNKVKGYLIDSFKKKYLQEAKEREDELFKTFFGVCDSNIPRKIKNKVLSIYKEELNL